MRAATEERGAGEAGRGLPEEGGRRRTWLGRPRRDIIAWHCRTPTQDDRGPVARTRPTVRVARPREAPVGGGPVYAGAHCARLGACGPV